jgi:hypothetical protein
MRSITRQSQRLTGIKQRKWPARLRRRNLFVVGGAALLVLVGVALLLRGLGFHGPRVLLLRVRRLLLRGEAHL